MKRRIALLLCMALCFGLVSTGFAGGNEEEPGPEPGGGAGAFTELDTDGDGNYVVYKDFIITAESSVHINSGTVTINEGATLTVAPGGRLELQTVDVTNNGTIVVKAATVAGNEGSPSNEGQMMLMGTTFENNGTIEIESTTGNGPENQLSGGRLEIRSDIFPSVETGEPLSIPGKLSNTGSLVLNGLVEVMELAVLENKSPGTVDVDGFLRCAPESELQNEGAITIRGRVAFDSGAKLINKGGGSITGEEEGRIELRSPAENAEPPFNIPPQVEGLNLYENAEASEPLAKPLGEFRFHDGDHGGRWVRNEGGHGPDPGDPGGPGGDHPGAFARFLNEPTGNYTIDEDITITAEDSVNLSACQITIDTGITLTIAPSGCLELRGVELTNNGKILIEYDNDPHNVGRMEIRSDTYHDEDGKIIILDVGVLENNGDFIINGEAGFADSAELSNENGTLTVNGSLRFSREAKLENKKDVSINGRLELADGALLENAEGASIKGGTHGRIRLDDSGELTGFSFYKNASAVNPFEYPSGEFKYDKTSERWIVSLGPGGEPGDGTSHVVTVSQPAHATVAAEGLSEGKVTVLDGEECLFIIEPNSGYKVVAVYVGYEHRREDQGYNIRYHSNGKLSFLLEDVREDLTLEFELDEAGTAELFTQTYVVQNLEGNALIEDLARQFGAMGYAIKSKDITIVNVDHSTLQRDHYGTFTFRLGAEGAPLQTGYIIEDIGDVIFKLTPETGEPVIRVAQKLDEAMSDSDQIEVPAMDSGYMQILGYGNLSAFPYVDGLVDENGNIPLPFYQAQFHLGSFSANINLYGYYVIQENALCVRVEAASEKGIQRSLHWDLGRFVGLTKEEGGVSEVFFGNDKFTISLPEGIGAATSLEVDTGDFVGYRVTETETNGAYVVEFLSDYYDRVTIELTLEDKEDNVLKRNLLIHRVGFHLNSYVIGGESNVFHGTQGGTIIEWDSDAYRVYGSYYIPDFGDEAPRVFATYTWADGSVTTAIIEKPCNYNTNDEFLVNGVFKYKNDHNDFANVCDYLLYAGPNKTGAPVAINVIVLKEEAQDANSFGGVFFGSGKGVLWVKED